MAITIALLFNYSSLLNYHFCGSLHDAAQAQFWDRIKERLFTSESLS